MDLPKVIDGLILQAMIMTNPSRAADLLIRRASTIRDTPLSRWPAGVTAWDVSAALDRLYMAARDIREAAGLRPLAA